MARRKAPAAAVSPQAKLAAVIKSARDAMRKDAGLNGDLDRIPQLAWILFLKAFDGIEESRAVTQSRHRPAIEEPYRWRDWAADPNGPTGEALLEFVDGRLLPYLRGLSGTGAHDPRDVLAGVFKETHNRMLSGHLLRDVVNKVNEINFASSDDIHTMAHLYESMLREMRDAAGDSGEFYTPRPAIRFIVQQIDPQLGEIVLDPACGTGGFLVEALDHLATKVQTADERRRLHSDLRGIEKKPLPYLLGMMNLLLHGVGNPNITRGNALTRAITQIGKRDRVDAILTNPPFGGEEEKSVQANFPADKRTSETAWLFLQLVIRLLKDGGRCGIVVPNGLLFGGGVGARIKQQLLTECNLHTVVRLPDGVFEPYTAIPSNLLFFEKTGRTKEVWFYEIPPPEGRKKYSKTKPMRFEEFAGCQAWWNDREESERAWRVPFADIESSGFNLDLRNPHRPDDLAHRPPGELLEELIETEREILGMLEALQADVDLERADAGIQGARAALASAGDVSPPEHRSGGSRRLALSELMEPCTTLVQVDPGAEYRLAGVFSFGKGLIDRGTISGADTSYATLNRLHANDVVMSKLNAWEGAIAVVNETFDGACVSSEFPTFRLDESRILPAFFACVARVPAFWAGLDETTRGSMVRRRRITPEAFLQATISLPSMATQIDVVRRVEILDRLSDRRARATERLAALVPALVDRASPD